MPVAKTDMTKKWLPDRPDGPGWNLEGTRAVAMEFDPLTLPDGFTDNPYPIYRALLDHDPVHACPDGSYFISHYQDLVTIYRDTTLFSSDKIREFKPKYGDTPLYEHHTTSLVFNDPPLHTRVRKLIVGALSPRAIARMEPGLLSLVEGLLDKLDAQGSGDAIEEFAAAIPIEIIGNLLGVPRSEREPLRRWSLAILGALEPAPTRQQLEFGNISVEEFIAYLKVLIAKRRKNSGDPDTDVLTRLIQGEVDGVGLSELELLHNCIFILNAGHETTTNLIGNALYALMEWPDQRQRLIAEPGLIDTAIDEVLRFESSNQIGNRITTGATELGGVEMPPQTRLTLSIAGANRDPDQFPDPDHFDIGRTPNKHLAFAGGPHLCAGLSLARMEGRVAISRFLARFPDYGLGGTPERSSRIRFRGFVSLPVKLA